MNSLGIGKVWKRASLCVGLVVGFNQAYSRSVTLVMDSFQKHCVECHGLKGKVKGQVDLLAYTGAEDIKKNPELLQRVLEVIDFGEMPPEEKEPIPTKDQQVLVTELKKMLTDTVSSQEEGVAAPIRRMTRFQYANAVKDL